MPTRGRQRVMVGSGLTPERLQPRASPSGSFVAPERSRTLRGLAQGLAEIAPSLGRFADQTLERRARVQEQKGRAEAQRLLEDQQTYRQAVRDGLIRQDQNPWFRLGMKRQFATVAADRYAARLHAEANALLAGGATDPEQLQALEAQLRREFVAQEIGEGNRDAGFDAFFADAVNQRAAGIARQFAAQAGAQAVRQSTETVGAEAMGILDNLEGLETNEVGERLDELARWAIQEHGLDGTRVNEVLEEAIITHAVTTRDPDALLYARSVKTHGGKTLADIPRFRRAAEEAARRIEDLEDRDLRREQTARQEEAYKVQMDYYEEVRQKGLHNVDHEDWNLRMGILDPRMATDPLAVRGRVNQALQDYEVDPLRLAHIQARAQAGELSMHDLMQGWQQGVYSDTEYLRAIGYAAQYAQWQHALMQGSEDPFKEDYWQDSERFIRRVAGSESIFESFGAEAGRQAEILARQALTWARERWWQYWTEGGGREAGPMERMAELDRIFEATRRQFFPLQTQEAQAAVAPHNPLDWNKPILQGDEVAELRTFLDAEGTLSNSLALKLWRYGVPFEVINLQNPNSLERLEALTSRQERAYGIVREEESSPVEPEQSDQSDDRDAGESSLTAEAIDLLQSDPKHSLVARRVLAGTARQESLLRAVQAEIARLEKSEDRLLGYEAQGGDPDNLSPASARVYQRLVDDVERLEVLRGLLNP